MNSLVLYFATTSFDIRIDLEKHLRSNGFSSIDSGSYIGGSTHGLSQCAFNYDMSTGDYSKFMRLCDDYRVEKDIHLVFGAIVDPGLGLLNFDSIDDLETIPFIK